MPIPDEVTQIVRSSGNSFHASVVRTFREAGWRVLVSPYYLDSASSKSREIDLIAEKAWLVNDVFGRERGTINLKLFVECKYIPNLTVFWFDSKDKAAALRWLTSWTPLRENNAYTERHHYLSVGDQVAKLFASRNFPNWENEAIYKGLNQALSAMVYLRGSGSIIPSVERRGPIERLVELPVIVCNSLDNFYRVQMGDPDTIEEVAENFQLEVDYAYLNTNRQNRQEYFLIDVVALDRLPQFFTLLDEDVGAMRVLLG